MITPDTMRIGRARQLSACMLAVLLAAVLALLGTRWLTAGEAARQPDEPAYDRFTAFPTEQYELPPWLAKAQAVEPQGDVASQDMVFKTAAVTRVGGDAYVCSSAGMRASWDCPRTSSYEITWSFRLSGEVRHHKVHLVQGAGESWVKGLAYCYDETDGRECVNRSEYLHQVPFELWKEIAEWALKELVIDPVTAIAWTAIDSLPVTETISARRTIVARRLLRGGHHYQLAADVEVANRAMTVAGYSCASYDLGVHLDRIKIRDLSAVPPTLAVAPATLDFGDLVQGTSRTRELYITNAGSGTLDWTASPNKSWITLDRSGDSCGPGETKALYVTVDTGGLPLGPINGALEISSNGGSESVPVTAKTTRGDSGTITRQPGRSDGKDTFIIENDGGRHGDWNYLLVKKTPGAWTLIQFPLQSVYQQLEYANIKSADMELYARALDLGSESGSLSVKTYRAAGPWNEDINWFDQPGYTGSSLGTMNVARTGWASVDLRSFFQKWADGERDDDGFCLVPGFDDFRARAEFHSSDYSADASKRPKLTLSYELGPPGPLDYVTRRVKDDGNSDGYPNPGEELGIEVKLRNTGQYDARDVRGVISTSDRYIELLDARQGWPDLDPGEAEWCNGDFDVRIAPDAPVGHVISFELMMRATGGGYYQLRWYDSFDITVMDSDGPPAPQVSSKTHPHSDGWFPNNQPSFDWSIPDDPSGIVEYCYKLNDAENYTPQPGTDPRIAVNHLPPPELGPVNDGAWWFHVRAKDGSGNWGDTGHYKIQVDTRKPATVASLFSPSHETEHWSGDDTIDLTWNAAPDNMSGISAYFVVWDHSADTPPPDIPDAPENVIPGDLTEMTTAELGDGRWYIHVTAADRAGNVADEAIHLGPFWIDATPPQLVSASPTASTQVRAEFNDEMEQSSAEDANNYTIDPPIDVTAAALLLDGRTVQLTTSDPLQGDVQYTLTVNNVLDKAGNAIDQQNNTAEFSIHYEVLSRDFPAEWGLYTVPLWPKDPDAEVVFGTQDVCWWNPTVSPPYISRRDQPLDAEPGRGLWVNFASAGPRDFEGIAVGSEQAFTYEVEANWNLCGYPWPQDMPWADFLGSNPDTVSKYGWIYEQDNGYKLVCSFKGLNAQNYVPAWRGFWVHVNQPPKAVSFPPPGTGAARAQEDQGPEIKWTIPVVVSTGAARDRSTVVGVSSRALSIDNPPAIGAFVDAYLTDDSNPDARLACDLKGAEDSSITWDIVVATNLANTEITIMTPDLSSLPKEYRAVLEDLDGDKTVHLRTTASYTYNSGAQAGERHFRLRVEQTREGALTITGLTAEPVRGFRGATIRYTLSQPAAVAVRVYNIAGRLLREIERDRVVAAGEVTTSWDGRSRRGTLVPTGAFLVEVSAASEDGQKAKAITRVLLTR